MGRVKCTVMIHHRVQTIIRILFTQKRIHPAAKEIRSLQLNSQLVPKRKNQQWTVVPLKHGLKNWGFLVYGVTVNLTWMRIKIAKTKKVLDKGVVAANVIVKKVDAGDRDQDHLGNIEGQGHEVGRGGGEATNVFTIDQFHVRQIDQGTDGEVTGRRDRGPIVEEGEDSVVDQEV